MNKEDIENEDKIDDPSVFSFDLTCGKINPDNNLVR